jgi:hypothetical protein
MRQHSQLAKVQYPLYLSGMDNQMDVQAKRLMVTYRGQSQKSLWLHLLEHHCDYLLDCLFGQILAGQA